MQVGLHAWGSDFQRLADHVRSMMDEMGSANFFRSHAPDTWRPRINFYETADRYVVCVELCGMRPEDVDLCAERGKLRIRGVRPRPAVPADPGRPDAGPAATTVSVHVMEIDSGPFHRKIALPPDADIEKITASHHQGYLWIGLPRKGGEARGAGRGG